MKKVIVISAHPDDEVLGCGGTLLKHARQKDEISWIIVTNVFEQHGFSAERVSSRQNEIEAVKDKLGIKSVYKLDFPTMQLDPAILNQLIARISEVFIKVQPEIVYTLNRSDAHSDHRIVFDAVAACTKSFRYPFIRQVLMYECISETEFAPALSERAFVPNYFVDISEFIDLKLEIMSLYRSEMAPAPFPRSKENIKALATFRGSTAGVLFAEAFQLIKYIDK